MNTYTDRIGRTVIRMCILVVAAAQQEPYFRKLAALKLLFRGSLLKQDIRTL